MRAPKPGSEKVSTFKYLFKADTIVATTLVFIVIGLLSLIPINMHFFDPKEIGSKDFDYGDLPFNLLDKYKNMPVDPDIVIVNIGTADRKGIANIINKVVSFHPHAIGVDILFDHALPGIGDSALRNVFESHPAMVLAYQIKEGNEIRNYFNDRKNAAGVVNFTLGSPNVVRNFSPVIMLNGRENLSFAAAIMKQVDVGKYNTLLSREHDEEIINYTRSESKFIQLNGTDSTQDFSIVKNKIVLFGYVSPLFNYEDKHFTPLNPQFTGKGLPDLNGVFIHANILRMIMDGNYIHRTPVWFNWLLAFVLCWIHMAFFISYFIEKHVWFHLVVKTTQLLSAVLFIYLGLILFRLNLQIDLSASLIAIILAVDILYFYEAGILWLHRKKGIKTIFHHAKTH